jgi:hypothetical protein
VIGLRLDSGFCEDIVTGVSVVVSTLLFVVGEVNSVEGSGSIVVGIVLSGGEVVDFLLMFVTGEIDSVVVPGSGDV